MSQIDYSIPSSLAHPVTVDKKYRTSDSNVRDTKEYTTCKDCGHKAEIDSCDTVGRDGVPFISRITRCKRLPSKSHKACKDYREDNPDSEEMLKLSDRVVFAYSLLNKDDKEKVAKKVGLTFKYIGYAMRKSNNRLLLQKTICDKVAVTVMHVFEEVKNTVIYEGQDMSLDPKMEAIEIRDTLMKKLGYDDHGSYLSFAIQDRSELEQLLAAVDFFYTANYASNLILDASRDAKSLKSLRARLRKEVK